MTAIFPDLRNQVPNSTPKEDASHPNIQPTSWAEGICQCESLQGVGRGRRGREQYLRDLETLDRIEQQALYPDPCFFAAMGEIAAGRVCG